MQIGAGWGRVRRQDTHQLLRESNWCRFHCRMICWNSRKPSKWNICLQAVNWIGELLIFFYYLLWLLLVFDMFHSLLRVSWGSDRGVTLSALPVQAGIKPHCHQCLLFLWLRDIANTFLLLCLRETAYLCVSVSRKATNTCKIISTLKLICTETLPVIVLHHILNIIQHSVQMGWKKQQRRPEQPNIQTVTGRKQAARWTVKRLH